MGPETTISRQELILKHWKTSFAIPIAPTKNRSTINRENATGNIRENSIISIIILVLNILPRKEKKRGGEKGD